MPVCGDRVGAAVPAARRGLARGRRGCGRACREPVGGFLILKGVLTSLSAPNCPHVAFPTGCLWFLAEGVGVTRHAIPDF